MDLYFLMFLIVVSITIIQVIFGKKNKVSKKFFKGSMIYSLLMISFLSIFIKSGHKDLILVTVLGILNTIFAGITFLHIYKNSKKKSAHEKVYINIIAVSFILSGLIIFSLISFLTTSNLLPSFITSLNQLFIVSIVYMTIYIGISLFTQNKSKEA